MLEVFECFICFGGPYELIHLLHQLVQRNCLLAEPTEESAERCQATSQLLHILEISGLLHSVDCCNLLRVALYPSLGNQDPSILPAGTPNTHFSRLSLILYVRRFA